MANSTNIKMPNFLRVFKGMTMKKLIIILSIVSAVILGFSLYFGLMSFSIYSGGLRFFLIFMLLVWSIPFFYKCKKAKIGKEKIIVTMKKVKIGWGIPFIASIALVVLSLLLLIIASPLFMAKEYHNIITVNEDASFTEDIENHTDMLVPIVDKELAMKLGDKRLGDDNLGSQFDIYQYTLSYSGDDIYWIGVIEHSGFFKWLSNSSTGSPGYVKISATKVPYQIELVKYPIKYVQSAYFGQDLERKIYFNHMDKMRASRLNVELDDNGKLFYVQTVYKKNFVLTGGTDTDGCIVFDPQSGESKYYEEGKEPAWVDRVQQTEMVIDQLNNWGSYKHGFFNTLFAKREVMQTSTGYAYITNTDENGNPCVYLYTGMTSVGVDESMVGIALVNLTTKQANLYRVSGATEESAMESAQGIIQEKNYVATWPVLVNYEGEPTYLIALKDAAGLVKAYAYVNLVDYSKVGWGTTIDEARASYNARMGITSETEKHEVTLTIDKLVKASDSGDTYYFIKFREDTHKDKIFKAHFSVNEEFLFTDDLSGIKVDVIISGNEIISMQVAAKE